MCVCVYEERKRGQDLLQRGHSSTLSSSPPLRAECLSFPPLSASRHTRVTHTHTHKHTHAHTHEYTGTYAEREKEHLLQQANCSIIHPAIHGPDTHTHTLIHTEGKSTPRGLVDYLPQDPVSRHTHTHTDSRDTRSRCERRCRCRFAACVLFRAAVRVRGTQA